MTSLALFLAAFIYYACRVVVGPAWLDGSELVAAGHLLAVPHPPGEPLYLLLSKLAELALPFGHPAARLAWLSALFGALAVERLFHVARRALELVAGAPTAIAAAAPAHAVAPASTVAPALAAAPRREATTLVALAVALIFALTPGMLAISHRAEVYSLQLFSTLASLERALAFRASGEARAARLGGLWLGVGFATHPFIAVIAAPGLLLAAGRRLLAPAVLLPSAGFAALATISYGLLALRAHAGGVLGWGDTSTLAGFADVVLGRAFHKAVNAPLAGARLSSLVVFLADQLGDLGVLVVLLAAAAGAAVHLRRALAAPASTVDRPRPALAVVLALALTVCLGYASRALWPFDPETPDMAGYFAPATASLVTLAGLGLAALAARDASVGRPPLVHAAVVAPALLVAASIGLPDRARLERYAGREVARRALVSVEPNAVVLLGDFNLLFMTWYLQAVEHARPDVLVLYEGSLARSWYRQRIEAAAPAAARWLRGEGPPPGPVYADFGVGALALPPELRARLAPAGLLLRVGGPPRPPDPRDWFSDRRDLDLPTRRALAWLHFRRLCFHAERDQPAEASWHASEADRLAPGIGLTARLRARDLTMCQPAPQPRP